MGKAPLFIAAGLLSLLLIGLPSAPSQGSDIQDDEEQPISSLESRMPGRLEETGTHFEIDDSEYLDIILDSLERVHLVLESLPEMIMIHIEASEDASTTIITIQGFLPSTTYYKYEDDYHNYEAFTTDDDGAYSYDQDISESHMIFIQPRPSTKFIPTDTQIGMWDPVSRIFTLTVDLDETVQIDEDDLTLEGNGHTIRGSSTGNGIYLPYGRTGVTIRNLNIEEFSNGIHLYKSNDNTLSGNTVYNNRYGINLRYGQDNVIKDNTIKENTDGL